MKIRLAVAATVVAFSLITCVSQEDAADSDCTWVGTITTEGNVTTVVNQSGSVWGGTAELVEEASIGVENGLDEYMFGFTTPVAAPGRFTSGPPAAARTSSTWGAEPNFICV